MKYKVYIYKKLNEKLTREWTLCWKKSDYSSFYNSPSWFKISDKVFDYPEKKIIVLRQNQKVIAVLPLVRDYRFGIESWCFPGKKFLNKSALLISSLSDISRLILSNSVPDNTYLDEVPSMFKNSFQNYTNIGILNASICPYIELNNEPLRYLSRKQYSKIKNKVNYYSSNVKHKVTKGNIKSLFTAYEIERNSSKYKNGTAEFVNKTSREFFELLCKYESSKIRFDFLIYNSTPIIHSIGIIGEDTYYALHTAYDKKFAKVIPGKQLLFYMLRDLNKRGFRKFDFSRGVNELKNEFTSTSNHQFTVHITKSPTTRWWWKTADKFSKKFVENKFFYPMYTHSKKLIKSI